MIVEPQIRPAIASRTKPWYALLAAIQFLTRIPIPQIPYTERTLSDALAYFPLVGILVGASSALVNQLLAPHLTRLVAAACTITFTVLITGALHEDGLADCADAFGSRHTRQRTLEILRDSRIGTYGAIALILSIGIRILLIAAMPLNLVLAYLISAHTLARWSPLPLSLLPAARPENGQGARIAQQTPILSVFVGTLLTLTTIVFALHTRALPPGLVSLAVTSVCARYFNHRIQGVTGDCFGATTQVVEIAVLACGAWTA